MEVDLSEIRREFESLGLKPREPETSTQPEGTSVKTPSLEPAPGVTYDPKNAQVGIEPSGAPNPEQACRARELEELKNIFYANRHRLLSLPGVTAVDIGYKIDEDGVFLDAIAIRVHVERKIDKEDKKGRSARKHELIEHVLKKTCKGKKEPLSDVIQAIYGPNVRTPVLLLKTPKSNRDIPLEKQSQLLRSRVNPLAGGISIGSQFSSSGTLGALVWDETDGSVCILSNWHVLAGRPGASVGDPCFQPGLFDQGLGGDVVARLKRWSFGRQTDAALAELDTNRRYCPGEILAFPGAIGDAIEPHLGMVVFKTGRSTGFTAGFIDGILFTSTMDFGNGVVQLFEEQVHIAPFSQTKQLTELGDSGSVWVTEVPGKGLMAVGLHFAGDLANSSFGEFAVANPMVEVKKRLKFSFRPLFVDESEPTQEEEPRRLFSVPAQSVAGFTAPFGIATGRGRPGPQPVPEVKDTGGKTG